jgi:acyl-CoA thioester hydrolase
MHEGGQAHETPIRVRYDEVDRMGVVHHPRYLGYFEQGRTEYLRSLGGSYRALEDSGTLLMVVEASARYLKPAHYDDVLTVRTRLADLGPVRLRFEYEVVRDRVRIATGHTVLAACDVSGRPRRVPEEFRTLIEAHASGKARSRAAVQGS